MLKVWMAAVTLLSILFLTGCENTARGLGQDTDQNVKAVRKVINEN